MGRILRLLSSVFVALAVASQAGAISFFTSLPESTFASLPACGPTTGPQIYRVTNASAVGTCDGGGTADTECICDPETSTYRALGGSGGGGSSAFAALTAGTNTTAAMVVGTGASITPSGSGSIVATSGDSATSFFSSGLIGVGQGGTGLDTSTSTGLPTITGGTWSVASALGSALGGTGDNTSGTTGVPIITAGDWTYPATVSRALGGLGSSTAAYGTGILGSDGSNNTVDVDTEAELETALGGIDLAKTSDNVASATLAATASAGDSATGFFPAGAIERARGGTGADTSAYGAGLFGSDAGNITLDVDTEAELETALGGLNLFTSTDEATIEGLLEVDQLQGDFTATKLDLGAGAADRVCAFDALGDPDCTATLLTASVVQDQAYNPTTSADWPGYSTNTLKSALDYLANMTDINRSGTASASTVTCDFVGQYYVETDTEIISSCSATGSPGVWIERTTRRHATDCTTLTDGKAGQLCQNIDDNKLFVCNPTAGDCSGAEWIEYAQTSSVHNDHGLLSAASLLDDDHTQYTQRSSGTTDPRTGSVNCDTVGDIYVFTTPTPDISFICKTIGATGVWSIIGEYSIIADEQQTSITTAGQCVTIGYADSNNFATASCTSAGQIYYATEDMMITGFTVRQIDTVVDNTGCTITLELNETPVTGATIHTGDTGGTADINAAGETLTINLAEPFAAGNRIRIKTDDDTGTHCENAGAAACDCDAWDLQWRVGVRGIMQ